MEMKAGKEEEGDCGGCNINHVVMIGEMTRLVVIWDAWYECKVRKCSTHVIFVNVGMTKLPKSVCKGICYYWSQSLERLMHF